MKRYFLGFIIALVVILVPLTNIAEAGLVPNCNSGTVIPESKDSNGVVTQAHFDNTCDLESVMQLVNNVINFLLIDLASPLAAIIICYAGFLMITSGGSSEKVTKVKKIITRLIIGYIIALAAWLIIHTILSTLGFSGPNTSNTPRAQACVAPTTVLLKSKCSTEKYHW